MQTLNCVHLVGVNCNNYATMHGVKNVTKVLIEFTKLHVGFKSISL
jgi:hypothetical protein